MANIKVYMKDAADGNIRTHNNASYAVDGTIGVLMIRYQRSDIEINYPLANVLKWEVFDARSV